MVIEIWDDGPGMSEEVQTRIFEPFFTTKSENGGTGLGLLICHNIVEDLGGQITLKSQLGQGSCFRLTFPSLENYEPEPTPAPPVPRPDAKPNALQILVVDDEPLVARALQRMLRNHNVHIAHHGADALKMCRANQYDTIFCDVMMPQMNGLQLLTMLKEIYPQMAPKLVFMSGGVFDSDVANHLSEVQNAMVEKPFVPGQIHEAIQFITQHTQTI